MYYQKRLLDVEQNIVLAFILNDYPSKATTSHYGVRSRVYAIRAYIYRHLGVDTAAAVKELIQTLVSTKLTNWTFQGTSMNDFKMVSVTNPNLDSIGRLALRCGIHLPSVCRFLISRGANPNIIDCYGHTCLDLARTDHLTFSSLELGMRMLTSGELLRRMLVIASAVRYQLSEGMKRSDLELGRLLFIPWGLRLRIYRFGALHCMYNY